MLDARILTLRILPNNCEVDAGIVGLDAGKVLDRPKIGEELKFLTQRYVNAGEATGDRCRYRSFQGQSSPLDRLVELLRNVLLGLGVGLGSSELRLPFEAWTARLQHTDCRVYYLRADAIAGNQCNFMNHSV